MKIFNSNIQQLDKLYTSLQQKKSFCTNTPNFRGSLPCDTVELSKKIKELNLNEILGKFKNFSISEYKNLTENEIKFLRQKFSELLKTENPYFYSEEILKKHQKAANYIEETLDKKYGKNNYKVITLGRSLSSIGKSLSCKIGEDNVVNMPISDATMFVYPEYLQMWMKKWQTDGLKKFLENNNLTKEIVENSDKKYVLIDFCYTGDSLKGCKNLLEQDCFMGKKNLEILDFKDCIPQSEYYNDFHNDFASCRYKHLSFVRKTKNLNSDQCVINPESVDNTTKLTWFRLLDDQLKTS